LVVIHVPSAIERPAVFNAFCGSDDDCEEKPPVFSLTVLALTDTLPLDDREFLSLVNALLIDALAVLSENDAIFLDFCCAWDGIDNGLDGVAFDGVPLAVCADQMRGFEINIYYK